MLLAVDTATRFYSVALHDGERVLAEVNQASENQHSVQLPATISRLLNEFDLKASQLSGLVLAQGPGSYSGLRVGFGVVKGLATACRLPMIPIPTLEIVAAGTPYHALERLLAVLHIGRGGVIAGHYRWSDGWIADDAPVMTRWETLLPALENNLLVNGELDAGAVTQLEGRGIPLLPPVWRVRRGAVLAELGWRAYRAGEGVSDPAAVNPIYLREPG